MAKEYLSGPLYWAKVFPHNMDTGEYAPEGGQYTVLIGLGEEDQKKVLKWNDRFKLREIEGYPDLKFVSFKRKNEVYKKDGTLIEEWSGPPKVCNIDGSEWEGGLIGNGSTGTIKLDVSSFKMGKRTVTGVRLEVVAIDEHVEYTKEDEVEDTEEGEVEEKAQTKRPF